MMFVTEKLNGSVTDRVTHVVEGVERQSNDTGTGECYGPQRTQHDRHKAPFRSNTERRPIHRVNSIADLQTLCQTMDSLMFHA